VGDVARGGVFAIFGRVYLALGAKKRAIFWL